MHLCLFEDDQVAHLRPLTATRVVYDLRIGMRTLRQTLREAFGEPPTLLHARPLVAGVTAQENDLLTNRLPEGLDVLFVNGRYVAEEHPVLERLRHAAAGGEPARAFVQGTDLVAAWVPNADSRRIEAPVLTPATFDDLPIEEVEGTTLVGRLWHLLDALRPALHRDYTARVDYNIYERPGAVVQEGAHLVEGERIYLGAGATVRPGAVLNAEAGPIYVGEDAVVMEHAVVRGPAFVGAHGQVRIGANVEGCAFGPWSKMGGEVHDVIIQALSNKVHSGFLGHSYLGPWCNLGADTNVSNLKNDYGSVALYDAATGTFEDTGRQSVGLFMGDHSKCGINTMFNTGTVVGPCCNIYGAGFPPRHVPAFSWGSPQEGFAEYRIEKALQVAEAVMARRNRPFTAAHRELLTALSEEQWGVGARARG